MADSNKKVITKAAKKSREVLTGPFMDIFTDVIATGATYLFLDSAGKLSGIVKSIFSSLGKDRDKPLTPEDVVQFIGSIKTNLERGQMSKSHKHEYERIMQEAAEEIHGAMLYNDDAIRTAKIAEVKRVTREKLTALAERYREEPFESRIVPSLEDGQQERLENLVMAMSPAEDHEWRTLRERVKSVEMFSRLLKHSTDSTDFLKRLKVYLGTSTMESGESVIKKKAAEVSKLIKAGTAAVDSAIKDWSPYGSLELPAMRAKELEDAYLLRLLDEVPEVMEILEPADRRKTDAERLNALDASTLTRLMDIPAIKTALDKAVPGGTPEERVASLKGADILAIVVKDPDAKAIFDVACPVKTDKQRIALLRKNTKFMDEVKQKRQERNALLD